MDHWNLHVDDEMRRNYMQRKVATTCWVAKEMIMLSILMSSIMLMVIIHMERSSACGAVAGIN